MVHVRRSVSDSDEKHCMRLVAVVPCTGMHQVAVSMWLLAWRWRIHGQGCHRGQRLGDNINVILVTVLYHYVTYVQDVLLALDRPNLAQAAVLITSACACEHMHAHSTACGVCWH
jgi:hypothetical protein